MPIATTNPATGEVLKTFEPMSADQIEKRLQTAVDGFAQLCRTSFEQRAAWMRAAADILEAERDQLAALMTTEMGKTFASARAEVTKCATGCRYYAEHAQAMLVDEPRPAKAVNAARAYTHYQPIGPVLAIMPWNFPLWQAIRFAAPALMAGNVGLLKHASNVPQTALFLGELFRRAGFPEGAFQTLLIGSDAVEAVLADDRVRAATLTGSEGAGRSVAEIAGRHLKKTVLELGGNDPYIVMPSADLDRAAEVATVARCQNNGQSCIAAKRFIVHTDVYDAFTERFVEKMRALKVGDPMDDDTDVGPLATEQGRADAEEQVREAVSKGAELVLGGGRPDRAGWWYPPTVVAGITPEMGMWHEEVFAPVAGLYRASSYEDAVRVANDSPYGLGSNAWTNDPEEQERFAGDLDAGMVFINGMTTSYPELPFGGVKHSGYGRELAELGPREFCDIKTVWVGEPDAAKAGAHVE